MAYVELQITVPKFLEAQLAALKARPACIPEIVIEGIKFRVQEVEFRENSIRHTKEAAFPVFYEYHGESIALTAEGFQTQIVQELVLHVAASDDVLAHPNGPPALVFPVPFRAIIDVDFYPGPAGDQCYARAAFSDFEFDEAPPLPPGIDIEDVKTEARKAIRSAMPAVVTAVDLTSGLSAPGPSAPKVLNAGVTVSPAGDYLAFRAELGAGSGAVDVRWSNFFKGAVTNYIAPADWGIHVERSLIEGYFTTAAWQEAQKSADPHVQVISVGSVYTNPGGRACVDTTIYANVDLTDPLGTQYVEPTIHTELTLSADATQLVANVALPEELLFVKAVLSMVRAVLIACLRSLGGFAEVLVGALVGNIDELGATGQPNCTAVDPLHQRCMIPLPKVGNKLAKVRIASLVALPQGVALTGPVTAPASLTRPTLTHRINELGWEPPQVSCGSASIALIALFADQVRQLARVKGSIELDHTGTTPVRLCDVQVLNDPGNKFPRSGISWDNSELPTRINLDFPNPGPDYAINPYPVDLLVITTAGTRLIRLRESPALSQAEIDRLVALVLGQVASCTLLQTPPGFDLKWLIDPPFDKTFVHHWGVAMTGLHPGDSIKLLDATGKQLVHVNVLIGGAAKANALLAPGPLKELKVVRATGEPGAPMPAAQIEIRQQLFEPVAAIPLEAPVRRLLASPLLVRNGLVALLADGIVAFDLANPARPRTVNRWNVNALRGAWHWQGGLLAFSEYEFLNIDADGRAARIGPADEPSPILDAALGERVVYVLTADALEVRSLRLARRSSSDVEGGRSLLPLGARLLVGGRTGITVHRPAEGRVGSGVRSLANLDVSHLELADDGSVLATLADGSARLLTLDEGDRAHVSAEYPEAPWFAGSARVNGSFVRIGAGARALEVSVLGESRMVGPDAADLTAPGLKFASWTEIGKGRAEGELLGRRVTLVGPLGAGSVTDQSFTLFGSDAFTPPLPHSDAVNLIGRLGNSFELLFDAPVKDPVLQLASFASRLSFLPGTAVSKVSGQPTLTVSGSSVSGLAAGSLDSNGTIRVYGLIDSLDFALTPTFGDGTVADGVYLQVGALPAPS